MADRLSRGIRRAEIGIHHHIAGLYLAAYAAEMGWRKDRRRISNGEQFLAATGTALAHLVCRQWKDYWQREAVYVVKNLMGRRCNAASIHFAIRSANRVSGDYAMRERLSQPVPTNDNGQRGLEVAVAERSDFPGAWGVEAVDTMAEGEIYQALFLGPRAKERAYAYACLVYGTGLP